jgi:hypothetical protein
MSDVYAQLDWKELSTSANPGIYDNEPIVLKHANKAKEDILKRYNAWALKTPPDWIIR